MFQKFKAFMKKKPKNVPIKKIILGICAMDKKAKSKPMREILKRLPEELFEIVIFGDECILNEDIESWPVVDVLISFFSKNFPTEKAVEYVNLRKPYMLNDLEIVETLKDRRSVYNILEAQGINVPLHVFLDRSDPDVVNIVEEFDEYIIVNGIQIDKPLVEKPVDAEDHNIYIYYPLSAGGGSKRLYRKIDDRSSTFYPTTNELRKTGSFIYEKFVVTQGTDVKVYTMGPDYAHAEARKSPVVDGRVNRDAAGLEVRYPVILSPLEKEIARKIVLAFKQNICGFDILRVKGKSYCCDVNGFSFVKNSRKYYDDASQILCEMSLIAVRPEIASLSTYTKIPNSIKSNNIFTQDNLKLLPKNNSKDKLDTIGNININNNNNNNNDDVLSSAASVCSEQEIGAVNNSSLMELRAVIAVIRHGDRTPKQKMKIIVNDPKYLEYFHNYSKNSKKELKVKSKVTLLKFLHVTKEIISNYVANYDPILNSENLKKLRQIRDVLECREISGINRKLQMKPQKWNDDEFIDSNESSSNISEFKVQATELLLILKWGGDLTPLGCSEAEAVGMNFRHIMYPDNEGGGVLRLHATYRHDLKINSSDEGRVMKTAAAFAKGLLELEGELPPILASLVTVEEKTRKMLDRGGNCEIKQYMDRCKDNLNLLQVDEIMTDEKIELIAPGCSKAIKNAMLSLKNPLRTLNRMHVLIGLLCSQLDILGREHGEEMDSIRHSSVSGDEEDLLKSTKLSNCVSCGWLKEDEIDLSITNNIKEINLTDKDNNDNNDNELNSINKVKLYLDETFNLMADRWEKIHKDFFSIKTNKYDLTKVPDVYDMVRFDILHNSHLKLDGIDELFELSMAFENSVVPQEYGSDNNDKRIIGSKMCGALLEKIKHDLTVTQHHESEFSYNLDHSHAEDLLINSLGRCVRTRLYFTSESHLHTLLNVLRFPKEGEPCSISPEGLAQLDKVSELGYLTQVIIRLFEDKHDSSNYRCELSFSPGALINDPTPYVILTKSISCEKLLECLDKSIFAGKDIADDEFRINDNKEPREDRIESQLDFPDLIGHNE